MVISIFYAEFRYKKTYNTCFLELYKKNLPYMANLAEIPAHLARASRIPACTRASVPALVAMLPSLSAPPPAPTAAYHSGAHDCLRNFCRVGGAPATAAVGRLPLSAARTEA